MRKQLSSYLLCASALLCACSGENTTTLLDIENDAINLTLPDRIIEVIDDGIFDDSLRPEVTVNDATVSVNRGVGNEWSGSINLPTNAEYDVSVTWVEQYLGQRLPLASRTTRILVAASGRANDLSESGTPYVYDFDADGDNRNNFIERTDADPDTDPFVVD